MVRWAIVQQVSESLHNASYTCMFALNIMQPLGGEDYTPVHSTIVFSESIRSVEVPIITELDQLLEGTESFSVQLSHDHSEENVLLLPSHSNILIRDRDSKFASESIVFHCVPK